MCGCESELELSEAVSETVIYCTRPPRRGLPISSGPGVDKLLRRSCSVLSLA